MKRYTITVQAPTSDEEPETPIDRVCFVGDALGLTFKDLRAANVRRCNSAFGSANHLDEWSPNDWATALAGEVGELCNELKKLRRGDDTTPEERLRRAEKIRYEAGDVVCYLDLLCARLGIDLGEAVRVEFNIISAKRRSDVRL